MLSVDTVLSLLREKVAPAAASPAPLAAALGHVLAGPVRMAEDSPPFDRALLDGFAVRSADVSPGGRLRVIGQVNAGALAEAPRPLAAGECVGINTGAPMPAGADAVLMVEHSESGPPADGEAPAGGGRTILAMRGVAAGYGIQRRGADARAEEVVLAPGRRLSARDLAVAATAGVDALRVCRPRVALLTTGDELVPPGHPAPLAPGQIRNSNHPLLTGLLAQAAHARAEDGTLLDLGTAGDDAGRLRGLLDKGLRDADLLVVSGGMSMGTRDLVPPLLKELGVVFHVEKVRIKPGKPFVFGTWEAPGGGGARTRYVAGLPGNPVSAFVTFHLFVRQILAGLTGDASPRVPLFARTAASLPANGDRDFYQPCTLAHEGPTRVAHPLHWKGSADLFTLARADALLVRPANAPAAEAGATVTVLHL